jgi:diguanylate cyclase (GGDEF)-like protein
MRKSWKADIMDKIRIKRVGSVSVSFVFFVVLYIVLFFATSYFSSHGIGVIGRGVSIPGIITALEFVVAIAIALSDYRIGGWVSIGLLSLSLLSASISIITSGDLRALSGVMYNVASIVGILMIRRGLKNERKLADIDPLTGVANKRAIIESIEQKIELKRPFYLLFLDLDHFKELNDTYGHEEGDVILSEIASKWNDAFKHYGQLGRYGGDEFLYITLEKDEDKVKDLAKRFIRVLLSLDINIDINVSVSIGIVKYDGENNITVKKLISNADTAMYNAKMNGRHEICVYNDSLSREKTSPTASND